MKASSASRLCDVSDRSCVVDLVGRFDLDGPRESKYFLYQDLEGSSVNPGQVRLLSLDRLDSGLASILYPLCDRISKSANRFQHLGRSAHISALPPTPRKPCGWRTTTLRVYILEFVALRINIGHGQVMTRSQVIDSFLENRLG